MHNDCVTFFNVAREASRSEQQLKPQIFKAQETAEAKTEKASVSATIRYDSGKV